MALRNQTEFPTSSDDARASEGVGLGAAMRGKNGLEPETKALPEVNEAVGDFKHGLLRLIGSSDEILETLERPTPTPRPLLAMNTTASPTTIASWQSLSPAPAIDYDPDTQDMLSNSLPLPRLPLPRARLPLRESPAPELPAPELPVRESFTQGPLPVRELPLREPSPMRETAPSRESSPIREPSPLVRESAALLLSPLPSSTSSSRPPSAHRIAVVVPRPVITWEEAARRQRIAQAPPRPPPPPRRSTRVRPSTREEPVETPEKKQLSKQERNRRRRARKKILRQLKKSVPQDAVGGQSQNEVMDVDLEAEGQEQEQGQGQGQGQDEDGGEERKLTARETVMQWQLDNGKMPVGRYNAPAVKDRKSKS